MSGFLSRDAEAVLSAQEAEARRDFYRTAAQDPRLAEHASRSPYQQQWTTALHPAMTSTQSQTSPHVFSTPAQNASWPSLSPNAFAPPAPHVVPSSPYSNEQHWSNAPWPTLHPDDVEMEGAGVVLIQIAPRKPPSPGVVICANIIGVTQNLFSAVTRSVPNQGREDSRHAKIETDMNQRYSPFFRVA
ncbi:MAG: hypothetical protein ALECFALPRED_005440 [Alectoria fallacina]|uniref:Uncharacterized protein n=1 Tax=Alectoria fallacina TaxID=1903189 RepID=A0A8H3EUT1_9LECA|nr:MAG: hypothetical protein ALECFALPRED_005440 [Alectoria fallacina]